MYQVPTKRHLKRFYFSTMWTKSRGCIRFVFSLIFVLLDYISRRLTWAPSSHYAVELSCYKKKPLPLLLSIFCLLTRTLSVKSQYFFCLFVILSFSFVAEWRVLEGRLNRIVCTKINTCVRFLIVHTTRLLDLLSCTYGLPFVYMCVGKIQM